MKGLQGVTKNINAKGDVVSYTFEMKKHKALIEDMLDVIEAETVLKHDTFVSKEDAIKELIKKRK